MSQQRKLKKQLTPTNGFAVFQDDVDESIPLNLEKSVAPHTPSTQKSNGTPQPKNQDGISSPIPRGPTNVKSNASSISSPKGSLLNASENVPSKDSAILPSDSSKEKEKEKELIKASAEAPLTNESKEAIEPKVNKRGRPRKNASTAGGGSDVARGSKDSGISSSQSNLSSQENADNHEEVTSEFIQIEEESSSSESLSPVPKKRKNSTLTVKTSTIKKSKKELAPAPASSSQSPPSSSIFKSKNGKKKEELTPKRKRGRPPKKDVGKKKKEDVMSFSSSSSSSSSSEEEEGQEEEVQDVETPKKKTTKIQENAEKIMKRSSTARRGKTTNPDIDIDINVEEEQDELAISFRKGDIYILCCNKLDKMRALRGKAKDHCRVVRIAEDIIIHGKDKCEVKVCHRGDSSFFTFDEMSSPCDGNLLLSPEVVPIYKTKTMKVYGIPKQTTNEESEDDELEKFAFHFQLGDKNNELTSYISRFDVFEFNESFYFFIGAAPAHNRWTLFFANLDQHTHRGEFSKMIVDDITIVKLTQRRRDKKIVGQPKDGHHNHHHNHHHPMKDSDEQVHQGENAALNKVNEENEEASFPSGEEDIFASTEIYDILLFMYQKLERDMKNNFDEIPEIILFDDETSLLVRRLRYENFMLRADKKLLTAGLRHGEVIELLMAERSVLREQTYHIKRVHLVYSEQKRKMVDLQKKMADLQQQKEMSSDKKILQEETLDLLTKENALLKNDVEEKKKKLEEYERDIDTRTKEMDSLKEEMDSLKESMATCLLELSQCKEREVKMMESFNEAKKVFSSFTFPKLP